MIPFYDLIVFNTQISILIMLNKLIANHFEAHMKKKKIMFAWA